MKRSGFILFFFSAVFAAFAQTNAEISTTREMSLPDCIQEALAHNLGLQIERYNPQISLYSLHSAYGGYDPVLSISGQRSGSDTGPGGHADGNSLSSSLGGLLPWGMTYGLGANFSESYGQTTPTNLF